ncbi:ATP phosphoribosyltransferase regulatory subunit [Comamonas sp. BIGb0124]|uniref:ATP phosphoribosyltransferase regulatory subunit n=1 Tax=Comamonas sp. BIGb0124 TaxID=2485130 RepID=UPI000F482640|nr:ATP phosphoribosyltransferase regulatory subunit [Comamonas sp. BIGb0124]ROR23248.1 ATP phosphoribosyltransferase regulatory subunit [Comamonas sp. BIGb0124]
MSAWPSTWLLPDHVADVLPSEARHIEDLRRQLLDSARAYGYELVMPPMLEYLESLLTGSGEALDLLTFKLVDQSSGRTLGVRADSTPQVARIDAHLLNRQGVTRLCYCGPVLHTRPSGPHATRDPLQFGAEIYGHAGLEADLEVLQLALECMRQTRVPPMVLDLADMRIVRSLLAGVMVDAQVLEQVYTALSVKDRERLRSLTRDFPASSRDGLLALLDLYGDAAILDEARRVLPQSAVLSHALDELGVLAKTLSAEPGVRVSFDLADLQGYGYYSGMRFAIYAQGTSDALLRGGRYDEVGAVFGRNRPAAGFSLDVKELVRVVPRLPLRAAIRAPWGQQPALQAAIGHLRTSGETVVCVLPGHESEIDEFECDRVLVQHDGQWIVRAA